MATIFKPQLLYPILPQPYRVSYFTTNVHNLTERPHFTRGERMLQQIDYRRAESKDLMPIAEVFLAAFPESVEHYVGKQVKPNAIADAFAVCMDAEPDALIVATVNSVVAGYIFAPSDFPRVFRAALLHGHLLKGLWHWISGQYGIGLRPVLIAFRNWLATWRDSRLSKLKNDAHILAIATKPEYQGMGIGSKLLEFGIGYLRSRGATMIRLEVRPDNAAAIHLYEKNGFVTKGRIRDTQGDWLIMMKDISAHD